MGISSVGYLFDKIKEIEEYCLYEIYSLNIFEMTLKNLLMDGDTDTNCCIVSFVCKVNLSNIYKI